MTDSDRPPDPAPTGEEPTAVDPTTTVALGHTGRRVPRVAIGTAPLASVYWGNDEATAVATVTAALDRGIGFVDTAPFYGLGEAETRVGTALAQWGGPRPVLATKVGRTLVGEGDDRDAVFDFGRDAVLASLESSLQRLGVDRVDIVHIHDPEEHLDQAVTVTAPVLAELRDQGVIDAVSVGTNVVATAERFLAEADIDSMLVAGRLTLLDDSAADLVARCHDRGVAYVGAGVFNSGVLARPDPGAWYDYGPAADEVVARAHRIAEVCARHATSLRAAAIHHVAAHPGVTVTVLGMAAPGEVDDNLALLASPPPAEVWDELDSLGLVPRRPRAE